MTARGDAEGGGVWVDVGAADDVAVGGCRGVEVGTRFVAVYRLAHGYYATDNVCSHQFAFLSEGCIDGDYVECPMHQGRFHIPTGTPQGAPVTEPVDVFPVKVVSGRVQVLVGDPKGI